MRVLRFSLAYGEGFVWDTEEQAIAAIRLRDRHDCGC